MCSCLCSRHFRVWAIPWPLQWLLYFVCENSMNEGSFTLLTPQGFTCARFSLWFSCFYSFIHRFATLWHDFGRQWGWHKVKGYNLYSVGWPLCWMSIIMSSPVEVDGTQDWLGYPTMRKWCEGFGRKLGLSWIFKDEAVFWEKNPGGGGAKLR